PNTTSMSFWRSLPERAPPSWSSPRTSRSSSTSPTGLSSCTPGGSSASSIRRRRARRTSSRSPPAPPAAHGSGRHDFPHHTQRRTAGAAGPPPAARRQPRADAYRGDPRHHRRDERPVALLLHHGELPGGVDRHGADRH